MNIVLVGINHKTAPIEIREKFYLKPLERELLLSECKNHPEILEAIIISTCNRTEVYVHALEHCPDVLLSLFFKIKDLTNVDSFKKYFYSYADAEAVRHLLRVTTGLDSLVLGEKQILGQVKEAAELSRKKSMAARQFNILSNVAIRTGKKARSETQIDSGGSSISWAAVKMAQDALGTLKGKSVLVIGAGKMGRLALEQLKAKGPGALYVMNRTPEPLLSLAEEMGAQAVSFWDIKEILSKVDVCICSASAPHYLIQEELVKEVMSSRKEKLLFVDISIPRNIDPAVALLKNVSLFSIDDLDLVVNETIVKRQSAVAKVEEIIEQKIGEFYEKLSKSHFVEDMDQAPSQESYKMKKENV